MLKTLNRSMQYGGWSHSRRPAGRLGIAWMFPMLAICSMMINGSMHLRRTQSVMSAIERGPRAITVPSDLPPINVGNAEPPIKPTLKNEEIISTVVAARTRHQEEGSVPVPIAKVVSSSPLNMPLLRIKPINSGLLSPPKESSVKKGAMKAGKLEFNRTMKFPKPIISNMAQKKEAKKQEAEPKQELVAAIPLCAPRQMPPPNNTVSACLLVRDDNNIMNEWIAYHYHVLKMRRLIVAVDPNSETSPSSVLDTWKDHIEIDLWTDETYMPDQFLTTGIPPKDQLQNITKFGAITHEEMMEINAHRYRQRFFLGHCYQKLKQERKTLVLHIDTDEYIVPNKLLRREKQVSVDPAKPGSILELIQERVKADPALIGHPCISILRLLFGSIENEEDEWASMPPDYDRMSFETLRWRYHGSTLNNKMHGHPKVLVDVSKIQKRLLSKQMVYSIHRPFTNFCRGHGESDYSSFDKFPITANHYLGSWDRYNARNDTRRSWQMYKEKATVNSGEDLWVQGWLEGFIHDVGNGQASRLLGQRHLKTPVATVPS